MVDTILKEKIVQGRHLKIIKRINVNGVFYLVHVTYGWYIDTGIFMDSGKLVMNEKNVTTPWVIRSIMKMSKEVLCQEKVLQRSSTSNQ